MQAHMHTYILQWASFSFHLLIHSKIWSDWNCSRKYLLKVLHCGTEPRPHDRETGFLTTRLCTDNYFLYVFFYFFVYCVCPVWHFVHKIKFFVSVCPKKFHKSVSNNFYFHYHLFLSILFSALPYFLIYTQAISSFKSIKN